MKLPLHLHITLLLISTVFWTTISTESHSLIPRWLLYKCKNVGEPCGWFSCSFAGKGSGMACERGKVVCKRGYKTCGTKCIPTGTNCNICEDTRKCGRHCLKPGESCTRANIVCLKGELPCGKFCYNLSTQQCLNQASSIICGIGEESCFGVCFDESKGQSCYLGGIVCNKGEFPVPGTKRCSLYLV